jgi:hypothetical protein
MRQMPQGECKPCGSSFVSEENAGSPAFFHSRAARRNRCGKYSPCSRRLLFATLLLMKDGNADMRGESSSHMQATSASVQ